MVKVALLSDPWGVATKANAPNEAEKGQVALHFYLTRGELQPHKPRYCNYLFALVAFLSDPWGVATNMPNSFCL